MEDRRGAGGAGAALVGGAGTLRGGAGAIAFAIPSRSAVALIVKKLELR